jgi:hypothetical protein
MNSTSAGVLWHFVLKKIFCQVTELRSTSGVCWVSISSYGAGSSCNAFNRLGPLQPPGGPLDPCSHPQRWFGCIMLRWNRMEHTLRGNLFMPVPGNASVSRTSGESVFAVALPFLLHLVLLRSIPCFWICF